MKKKQYSAEQMSDINILRINTKNVRVWIRLGRSLIADRRLEDAECCFVAARHILPGDGDLAREWFGLYAQNRIDVALRMNSPGTALELKKLQSDANDIVAPALEEVSKDPLRLAEQLQVCLNFLTDGLALVDLS